MYLVLITISLAALQYLWSRRKWYWLAWQLKGATGYPLIGSAYKFSDSTKIIPTMDYHQKKYGSLSKIWLGPNLFVYVDTPKDIETILTSQICLDKGNSYKFIQNVLGLGLITLRGQQWKEHRKLLNPSFHYNVVNKFTPIFNKHLRTLVKNLETQQNETIDVLEVIKTASMDMICETTMNKHTKTQSGENVEFLNAVHCLLEVIGIRMFKPWLHPEMLYRFSSYFQEDRRSKEILNHQINEIINYKNTEYLQKKSMVDEQFDDVHLEHKEKHIFIDRVLKLALDEKIFSFGEVRGETATVLLAGYETTATTSAFVLLMLALHPQYQEQVYDELNGLILSDESDVTVEELTQFKFLDMFIKETLRLFPSVPYLTREASSEIKLGKYTIPAGVEFVIGVMHMQRSKEHYPNPDTFDPDNFLPENIALRHPFSFLPFSAGARSCIGTRYANIVLKLLTIYVVKNFKLTTNLKIDDLKFRMNVTLNLLNKHHVQLHKRN